MPHRSPLSIRRLLAGATLVVAVVGVDVTTQVGATPTPTGRAAPADVMAEVMGGTAVPTPELHWSDCGPRRQCATAAVPLDYGQPDGAQISLAVARLPATDPAQRIGSLFVNPGGPGGSGLSFLDQLARSGTQLWPAELLARFDIVSFDPRGVGASTPVRCFDSEDEQAAFFRTYPAFPDTVEQSRRLQRQSRELADRCWDRSGSLLPHLGTGNVARDLELLRRAVGDEQLTYIGYSYGTYLGEVYANLFPGRVRRLVLDGVINPISYGTERPGLLGSTPAVRMGSDVASAQALRQFFDRCAATHCPFAQGGPPRSRYATLVQRLEAAPASVEFRGLRLVLSHQRLAALTARQLYQPSSWAALGEFLEAAYRATEPGVERPPATDDLAASGSGGNVAGLAIECADADAPHHPEVWPAIAAASEARAPFTGATWAYSTLPCASWRQQDPDRHLGPWSRTTSARALVLGNLFDPSTPYHDAQEAHALLPGSRLVTLAGWGHTTLGQSTCVNRVLLAYVVDGTFPPDGTTCAPDHQPFEPAPPGPPSSSAAAASALAEPTFGF